MIGKFEMIFVKKPKTFFEFIDLAFSLTFRLYNRKYFRYFQSGEIKIIVSRNITWTLDRRIWEKE